jgi:hypothetical protein
MQISAQNYFSQRPRKSRILKLPARLEARACQIILRMINLPSQNLPSRKPRHSLTIASQRPRLRSRGEGTGLGWRRFWGEGGYGWVEPLMWFTLYQTRCLGQEHESSSQDLVLKIVPCMCYIHATSPRSCCCGVLRRRNVHHEDFDQASQ